MAEKPTSVLRTNTGRAATIKMTTAVMSLLSVGILLMAAFNHPDTTQSPPLTPPPVQVVEPPQEDLPEYPTSDLDTRIFPVPDAQDQYRHFAGNNEFISLFAQTSGDGTAPTVALNAKDALVGFAPLSMRQGSAARPLVTLASDVPSDVSGSSVKYEGIFGYGTSLNYEAAVHGIKETLVLQNRPETPGDVVFKGRLFYNSSELELLVDGQPVTFYARTTGAIDFRDLNGTVAVRIPPGYVSDSSTVTLTDPYSGPIKISQPKMADITYEVRRYGEATFLDVIVPGAFLQSELTTPPFIVDPSLNNFYSQNTEETGTFDQYNDVTVLSGAGLTLRNADVTFHGNYKITVQAGATLTILDSTITSDATSRYGIEMHGGSLVILRTQIVGNNNGILVLPPTSPAQVVVWIDDTTISGSDRECVYIGDGSVVLTVTDTDISDCSGNGLSLPYQLNMGSGLEIHDDTFSRASIGFLYSGMEQPEQNPNPQFADLTFTSNRAAGFAAVGAPVRLLRPEANDNARGIAALSASDMDITDGSAYRNAVGVSVRTSTVDLSGFSITSSSTFDLDAEALSTVSFTGGNNADWVTRSQSSELTTRYTVKLLIVDALDNPKAGYMVYIKDRFDRPAAPETLSGADGRLTFEISSKRINPDNSVTLYTPHTFELGSPIDSGFRAPIETNLDLTLHATGDVDNDSISDTDEASNVLWFAPSAHVQGSATEAIVEGYADGAAITFSDGDNFLDPDSFAPLDGGSYRVYFGAWAKQAGPTMDLVVKDDIGANLLAATSFALVANGSMYVSPSFDVLAGAVVHPQFTVLAPSGDRSVVLTTLAFVREKDASGAETGAFPGAVTNVLKADSDLDYANDGEERRAGTVWWEVENLASTVRVVAPEATSGAAAVHVAGVRTIFDGQVPGTFVPNSHLTLWVRARAGGASQNPAVTLSLNNMAGANPSITLGVTGEYKWIEGPKVVMGPVGIPRVTIEDATDPLLNDITYDVIADRFVLWNTDSAYAPDNTPTDPLVPDEDFDSMLDGQEIDDWHTADRVEAESAMLLLGAVPIPGGILMSNAGDEARYMITVRQNGIYRVNLFPDITMSYGATGLQMQYLEKVLRASITDQFGMPVASMETNFPIFVYSQYNQISFQIRKYGSAFDARFNLQAGTYTLALYLDPQAHADYMSNACTCLFTIVLDKWWWQKFRLFSFDPDMDDDGVTDGVEYLRGMMPLYSDSDYDTLSDFEEVTGGADGFITDPRETDSDHDGLTDAQETKGAGDVDPTTGTDPSNPDTDGDDLPDGWIDGWSYHLSVDRWYLDDEFKDGIKQPWEGEDLNLDGAWNPAGNQFGVDASNYYAHTGGETNPEWADTDTDSMSDSWEAAGWRHGLTISVLNPLSMNDMWSDPDDDDLLNAQEYTAGTHPFEADFDNDGLTDYQEARAFMRTDVEKGLWVTDHYADLDNWPGPGAPPVWYVAYDPDPFNAPWYEYYTYTAALTDLAYDSVANSSTTKLLAVLQDGGRVVLDQSNNVLYVWDRNADSDDSLDHDLVLDGVVYKFTHSTGSYGPGSSIPNAYFRGAEILSDLNPYRPDSDGDGIPDGLEGPIGQFGVMYDLDIDNDLLINALDSDSDGDGLPDGLEKKSHPDEHEYWAPSAGDSNPYDADTDGDLAIDGLDRYPVDFDNDNLTGFFSHDTGYGWVDPFDGQEDLWDTYVGAADSDGDGLLDGDEDRNKDGVLDDGDTSPADADTDDDGLLDGPTASRSGSSEFRWGGEYFTGEGVASTTIDNYDVAYFGKNPWYLDFEHADYYFSSIARGQYWMTAVVKDQGGYGEHNRNLRVILNTEYGDMPQCEKNFTIPEGDTSWVTLDVGLINVNTSSVEHNVVIRADWGAFYLREFTLTPIRAGEGTFNTSARNPDTDGDGLHDGYEVGVNFFTAWFNNPISPFEKRTNEDSSNWVEDESPWFSNATRRDTDGDSLIDGFATGLYRGEEVDFGESTYQSDPSSNDTDHDRLSDPSEALELPSSPTLEDTDGDYLLDSYEPFQGLTDFDQDGMMGSVDQDSNYGPSVMNLDYESFMVNPNDNLHNVPLRIVMRDTVPNTGYDTAGTWIALDYDDSDVMQEGTLHLYIFDQVVAYSDTAGHGLPYFRTALGELIWNVERFKTFDGRILHFDTNNVWVELDGGEFGDYARYRPWNDNVDGSKPANWDYLSPTMWISNKAVNYRYHEVLNWSSILDPDEDHDGLINSYEPCHDGYLIQVSCVNPPTGYVWCGDITDCDNDGVIDGVDYSYVGGGGSNGIKAVLDKDYDGDELEDGEELFAVGGTDPRTPDTDMDGLWDGSKTHWPIPGNPDMIINKGEVNVGTISVCFPRTPGLQDFVPKCWDYDGDRIPDGYEVRYNNLPKDASDFLYDEDHDGLSLLEEYIAYAPEDWDEAIQGYWKGGTDPKELDTDLDAMPDSFEVHYKLDALDPNDKTDDPDEDLIPNYKEYEMSLGFDWWTEAANGAWPWEYALDPRSADTDLDEVSDYDEARVPPSTDLQRLDADNDGVVNAADSDSDGDGLPDIVERSGRYAMFIPHWAIELWMGPPPETGDHTIQKEQYSKKMEFNPDWITKYWVTSDPLNPDTDGDQLSDMGEWENATDPRKADTDDDGYTDAFDQMWNATSKQYESAATIQEFDAPEIRVLSWTPVSCSQFRSYAGCADILVHVEDFGAGIATLQAAFIGRTAAWAEQDHSWELMNIGNRRDPFETTITFPITMFGEKMGTFKVVVESQDLFGNTNATLWAGGYAFDEAKRFAKAMVEASPGIDPGLLGGLVGFSYGNAQAWADEWGFYDDVAAGRVDWGAVASGLGMLGNPGKLWDMARLDYMKTTAILVNPYTPSDFDYEHFEDDEGIYWLMDHGAGLSSASPWLRFAKAFWDGNVAGGVAQFAESMALSFGLGAIWKSTIEAIKSCALVAKLAAVVSKVTVGIAKILRGTLSYVVKGAQQVLRPIFHGIAAAVKAETSAIKKILTELAEGGRHALDAIRKGTHGFAQAVQTIAFYEMNAAKMAIKKFFGEARELVSKWVSKILQHWKLGTRACLWMNCERTFADAAETAARIGEKVADDTADEAARLALRQQLSHLSKEGLDKVEEVAAKLGPKLFKDFIDANVKNLPRVLEALRLPLKNFQGRVGELVMEHLIEPVAAGARRFTQDMIKGEIAQWLGHLRPDLIDFVEVAGERLASLIADSKLMTLAAFKSQTREIFMQVAEYTLRIPSTVGVKRILYVLPEVKKWLEECLMKEGTWGHALATFLKEHGWEIRTFSGLKPPLK